VLSVVDYLIFIPMGNKPQKAKPTPDTTIAKIRSNAQNYNIPEIRGPDEAVLFPLVYPTRSIKTLIYCSVNGDWRDVYYDAGRPDRAWFVIASICQSYF
jgi:hypothetical protein